MNFNRRGAEVAESKMKVNELTEAVIGAAIEVHDVLGPGEAVEALLPIHDAQMLTYLRLIGWHVGFLLKSATSAPPRLN